MTQIELQNINPDNRHDINKFSHQHQQNKNKFNYNQQNQQNQQK